MEKITYDFREDFKTVKTLFVKEELSAEDISEGLEAILFEIRVCFTTHAWNRMFNSINRSVDMEEVLEMLLLAGSKLLELKNGAECIVVTKDMKSAVVGNIHYQDGCPCLILSSVIRVERNDGTFKSLLFTAEDKQRFILI